MREGSLCVIVDRGGFRWEVFGPSRFVPFQPMSHTGFRPDLEPEYPNDTPHGYLSSVSTFCFEQWPSVEGSLVSQLFWKIY